MSWLGGVFVSVLALGLTSCSCGIFRDTYVSAGRRDALTETLVEEIAATHAFARRSDEDGRRRFAKGDVELLLNRDSRILVVRSSSCGFSGSGPWLENCETVSRDVAETSMRLHVPLRKLTTDELLP